MFAAARGAHCISTNGMPSNRLNKKVCKRPGVKLVTLLSSDELYSVGVLVKPTSADWANAQLRTSHRGQYIQDRDSRRCRAEGRLRSDVNLTFFGAATKSIQIHIEEASMSITTGKKSTTESSKESSRVMSVDQQAKSPIDDHSDDMPIFLVGGPKQLSPPKSRRPIQSSLEYGSISDMSSISKTCASIGRLQVGEIQNGVFPLPNGITTSLQEMVVNHRRRCPLYLTWVVWKSLAP